MSQLSLDLFLQASRDFESAQYRVLSGLQQTQEAFAQNTIYPHLRRLIDLHGTLQVVRNRLGDVEEAMKGDVKAIDLGEKTLLYEKPELGPDEVEEVKALIQWALPHLEDTIEEGRTLFEFVDDNYELAEVGLIPSYLHEGYLLVPARASQELHIFRYALSIFTKADERYRSLRTELVKTVSQGCVDPSPQSIKLDLVEERRDLPNPATYFFETQLDFPFEETMLPVAKRKLMRYLSSQEGEA